MVWELLMNIIVIVVLFILTYLIFEVYKHFPRNRIQMLKQLAEMAVHDVEQRCSGRPSIEKKDLARAAILSWMSELGLRLPSVGFVDAAIEHAVLLMNQMPHVMLSKAVTAVMPAMKDEVKP